ncbi:MAG: SDR family oxidoreductase [Pseudomonadota bacterium]
MDGKVSVVTGGGGEIGAAIAKGLASGGSKVAVCDINAEVAEVAAVAIRADGGEVIAYQLDVTSETSWRDAISETDARLGPLDVLVNCAGLFASDGYTIADLPLEEWRKLHAVNLDGTFLGIKVAVEAMGDRQGSIINIGSVVGSFGARSGPAYGTSKGAVRALTVQAAASCIAMGSNVRVNAIHPGYVLTEAALGNALKKFGSRERAEEAFATRSPRNRLLHPEDLVGAAVFLASDASTMMNGAEILVDDGLSTQMPGDRFGPEI